MSEVVNILGFALVELQPKQKAHVGEPMKSFKEITQQLNFMASKLKKGSPNSNEDSRIIMFFIIRFLMRQPALEIVTYKELENYIAEKESGLPQSFPKLTEEISLIGKIEEHRYRFLSDLLDYTCDFVEKLSNETCLNLDPAKIEAIKELAKNARSFREDMQHNDRLRNVYVTLGVLLGLFFAFLGCGVSGLLGFSLVILGGLIFFTAFINASKSRVENHDQKEILPKSESYSEEDITDDEENNSLMNQKIEPVGLCNNQNKDDCIKAFLCDFKYFFFAKPNNLSSDVVNQNYEAQSAAVMQ